MDKRGSYRRLKAYILAKDIVLDVYSLIKKFPIEEKFSICDQLRRASISILSNISEGLNRFSDKEKVHFLEMAYGSLMEVHCQMDISLDLNYINKEEFVYLENKIIEESKILIGIRNKYLYNSSDSSNSSNS